MPRKKRVDITPTDDEAIVIRFFMEAPYAVASTAHRFAGYVLRQRQLAQDITAPAPPTGTEIGQRREAAKRGGRPRKPVQQELPPENPQYEDDPASVTG